MKNFDQDTHIDFILDDLRAGTIKAALEAILNQAVSFHDFKVPSKALERLLAKAPVGCGVALPSLKVRGLDKAFTIMARLHAPVKLSGAPNHEPVDVICMLISPEHDGPVHLRRLARLSRTFMDEEMHSKIRTARDQEALRLVVNKVDGWLVAA